MNAQEIAAVYLKENSSKEKIFICSDGNAFWSEIPARNHAKTIRGTYAKFPEDKEEAEVEVKPKKKTAKK